MSCTVAKHALPITRFSTIRPATATAMPLGSSSSFGSAPCCACRSAASASRRKSFGKACPFAAQRRELAAALGDDLVLVLWQLIVHAECSKP